MGGVGRGRARGAGNPFISVRSPTQPPERDTHSVKEHFTVGQQSSFGLDFFVIEGSSPPLVWFCDRRQKERMRPPEIPEPQHAFRAGFGPLAVSTTSSTIYEYTVTIALLFYLRASAALLLYQVDLLILDD